MPRELRQNLKKEVNMLCDELWLMCAQVRQEDLWREVARHALKQRAQAHRPPQPRPWWRALGHILNRGILRQCPLRGPQRIREADELGVIWERAEELIEHLVLKRQLAVSIVRAGKAPRHYPLE
jgi:hypothetical protein